MNGIDCVYIINHINLIILHLFECVLLKFNLVWYTSKNLSGKKIWSQIWSVWAVFKVLRIIKRLLGGESMLFICIMGHSVVQSCWCFPDTSRRMTEFIYPVDFETRVRFTEYLKIQNPQMINYLLLTGWLISVNSIVLRLKYEWINMMW